MADTPKRGGPTAITTTTATVYTAPVGAGTYSILRSIHLTNETTSQVTATVGIGTTNTDAAGKRFWTNIPIPAGQALDWSGFIPLIGGASPDLLYGLCSAASGVTITVGIIEGP